jgi:hypothetical protein
MGIFLKLTTFDLSAFNGSYNDSFNIQHAICNSNSNSNLKQEGKCFNNYIVKF